jgi:hypothetical protein
VEVRGRGGGVGIAPGEAFFALRGFCHVVVVVVDGGVPVERVDGAARAAVAKHVVVGFVVRAAVAGVVARGGAGGDVAGPRGLPAAGGLGAAVGALGVVAEDVGVLGVGAEEGGVVLVFFFCGIFALAPLDLGNDCACGRLDEGFCAERRLSVDDCVWLAAALLLAVGVVVLRSRSVCVLGRDVVLFFI